MLEKLWTMAPAEVPMLEPDVRRQLHVLRGHGWGTKAIAGELGIARNTVKRYLRLGERAAIQIRPNRRVLDGAGRAEAERLFDGSADGNAVVVARMLRQQGYAISNRRCQELLEERRRARRVAEVATVRYETAPGHQLQVDFGQKLVEIGGEMVRIFLLVAVLGYSRRLFVKAFLAERHDDWREGIAEAFRRFGGVTEVVLGDNARALVEGRDRETGVVRFHPGYVAFARDWGFEPRTCAPYRARTKGKTEACVKYVKRNAIAEQAFPSFAALEEHLVVWMDESDERVHGTTHETPSARFLRDEKHMLRPLPVRPLPTRERRLKRRVAHDAFVDVDTVRYSVPYQLVRDRVEVLVGDAQVRIYRGSELVATHHRSSEPHALVVERTHFAGLWRPADAAPPHDPSGGVEGALEALGSSLSAYEAAVAGGAS
jgi:transposase